ncbi:MAG: DUF4124 domain-containing protein [Gammaproteobacteria bacterium]
MRVLLMTPCHGWLRAAGLIVLVATGGLAGAETYRWRDAQGQQHFGDTPPPGVSAERIDVQPAPTPLDPDEAARRVEALRARERSLNDATEAERARRAAADAAAADAAVVRAQRCEDARWALSALDSGRPVYRDEEGRYRVKRPPGQGDAYTGAREYLDDATRAQELAAARSRVEQFCGAPPTREEMARTDLEILHAEQCEKAAADLELLSRPGAHATTEELERLRGFLANDCAR